jgi:hypothetical protein
LPEAYFGPVARACRETGEVFPVRERTLRDHLARVGALERGEKLTRPIWAEGKTVRVLSIRRGVFDRLAEVEEPSKDDEELPFDD